jgi:dienelactone hydrolase
MPGYDRATKEMVRRCAELGYDAICPNLHWREAPGADPADASATVRAAGACPTTASSATPRAQPAIGARCRRRTAESP